MYRDFIRCIYFDKNVTNAKKYTCYIFSGLIWLIFWFLHWYISQSDICRSLAQPAWQRMHTLELSVSFCNSSFIIVDYTRADPGFPEERDANLEIGRIGQGRPPWVWSFLRKFAKLCDTPGFWENVLDSFSCFHIQIAYSNFTFCGVYTFSFLARYTISAKRAHPRGGSMISRRREHQPRDIFIRTEGSSLGRSLGSVSDLNSKGLIETESRTHCCWKLLTRQHSIRMRTAHFRWPLLDVSTSGGVGPQVNKWTDLQWWLSDVM